MELQRNPGWPIEGTHADPYPIPKDRPEKERGSADLAEPSVNPLRGAIPREVFFAGDRDRGLVDLRSALEVTVVLPTPRAVTGGRIREVSLNGECDRAAQAASLVHLRLRLVLEPGPSTGQDRGVKETDLYPPIKALLEGQGYTVKGEVGPADVVAVRGDEPPVIVELKKSFALALYHQAVDRLRLSETVYIAVPRGTGKAFQKALKDNTVLCRRLGLGLITVRLSDAHTEIHLDPGPYAPRPAKTRTGRLLREFARREGDPSPGGSTNRGLVTAYRQDCLKIAALLDAEGPSKGVVVATAAGVPNATRIMADDHYGWFERVERGVYALTPKGRKEGCKTGQ